MYDRGLESYDILAAIILQRDTVCGACLRVKNGTAVVLALSTSPIKGKQQCTRHPVMAMRTIGATELAQRNRQDAPALLRCPLMIKFLISATLATACQSTKAGVGAVSIHTVPFAKRGGVAPSESSRRSICENTTRKIGIAASIRDSRSKRLLS